MLTNVGRRVGRTVLGWDGVTAHPHRFGGVEYRLGERELGHVHGDECVDIPLPRQMRDELVASGLADPHPARPDSGWVTVAFEAKGDPERALALFRRSYELALAQRTRQEFEQRRALRVVGLEDMLADGLS